MRLEQYLLIESDITYEQYCAGIDIAFDINEGIIDALRDSAVKIIAQAFKDVKDEFEKISKEFNIGVSHLVHGFKNRDIFHMLKATGFNIRTLIKGIHSFTGLVHKGLLHVFKELHETGVIQKIRSGVIKIDEVLERYPILKKVGGPVIAGLLFYIWLNMTFIGHLDYDFDFTDMAKALKGNFSLDKLFISPEGLMLSTLFATGSLISAPWLGRATYNIILAIVYTAIKLSTNVDHDILKKMKSKIALETI